MKKLVMTALVLVVLFSARSQSRNNSREEDMSQHKKDVTLWYDAFNHKDPALIDRILSEAWVDIPSATGQAAGPRGVKEALVHLTTVFPDFHVRIDEILQEGDKVVVRSEITGTQSGEFMGLPAGNRKIRIQAVDIHEFRNRKIVRTWHTEDWMTGLRQLGVFDKQQPH